MLNNILNNKFRSLQYYTKILLKPVLQNPKYNFMYLVSKNWENIVGVKFKNFCKIEKINMLNDNRQCNLFIISFNSATSFYLNNNKQYIIDKIDLIFGYNSVSNLFIKEIPTVINVENYKIKSQKIDEEKIDEEKNRKINKIVCNIKHNELKESLIRLGETLF